MKSKITTLLLCLVLSVSVSAQQKNDSFFNYQSQERGLSQVPYYTPNGIEVENMNVNAPIGNGLFALFGISIIYAVIKRKGVVEL